MKNRPISEIMALIEANNFTDEDVKELWYDWFCKNSSLVNKGEALLKKLARIVNVNNGKFDPEGTYVFFKNNSPCSGSLYDDFRICDLKNGNVIWTITPKSGYKRNFGKAELWGRVNNFEEPILENASWKDIVEYFKK